MRYDRTKAISALLIVTSVLVSIIASYIRMDNSNLFVPITTFAALIAFLSTSLGLYASRKQELTRSRRRVFLIYAREDLEAARRLATELRDRGFAPWLDIDEITPGQVWQRAVLGALAESTIALVLVSSHLSTKKGFVQEELKVALDTLQERVKGISPVIPVRLDDTAQVPERLSHIQWVNLYEDGGIDMLFKGLSRVVGEESRTRA